MDMKVKVRIENLEQTIEVEVGGDLRSALLEADVMLYAPGFIPTHVLNCHGKGLCTQCRIEVVEGEEGLTDQPGFEAARIGKNRRLACQTRVYRDCVIRTLHQPAEVQY